jgi:hypothetical protein
LAVLAAILGAHGLFLLLELELGRTLWVGGWRSLVDPDQEATLANWVSSLGWFALAASMGWASRTAQGKATQGWLILALIAAFCGLDEAISLHERLASIPQLILGRLPAGGEGSAPLFNLDKVLMLEVMLWLLVYPLVVVAVFAFFARPILAALFSMERATMLLLGLGGALFLAGAVGMEGVSALGIYDKIDAAEEAAIKAGKRMIEVLPHYGLFVLIEETLEFLGVALAWNAVLRHLRATGQGLGLTLRAV